MALFSKAPSGGFRLPPLTRNRIEDQLKICEWKYFTDSDGDLGARWDNVTVYYFIMGEQKEVLQVRAMCDRTWPDEARASLLEFINDWSTTRIWPKMYLRRDDEGMLRLCTEVSTDLEHGVSDEQLGQLIKCGTATGNDAIDNAIEAIPPNEA